MNPFERLVTRNIQAFYVHFLVVVVLPTHSSLRTRHVDKCWERESDRWALTFQCIILQRGKYMLSISPAKSPTPTDRAHVLRIAGEIPHNETWISAMYTHFDLPPVRTPWIAHVCDDGSQQHIHSQPRVFQSRPTYGGPFQSLEWMLRTLSVLYFARLHNTLGSEQAGSVRSNTNCRRVLWRNRSLCLCSLHNETQAQFACDGIFLLVFCVSSSSSSSCFVLSRNSK